MVAAVNGKAVLPVSISAGNSPEVLVRSHSAHVVKLELPNTPNYLWPATDRAAWVAKQIEKISQTRATYNPFTGKGNTRKERRHDPKRAGGARDRLNKEINELAAIYEASPAEKGAALVVGHELGHAMIHLSDPTPNTPYGGT